MDSSAKTLFRVVAADQWKLAAVSGLVPRCPADEREDRIHLNERKDVERVADLWFSPEEQPLALEVDVSAMPSDIRWEPRAREPFETWPNLHAPNIRVEQVLAVHRLEIDEATGRFRMEASGAEGPVGTPATSAGR